MPELPAQVFQIISCLVDSKPVRPFRYLIRRGAGRKAVSVKPTGTVCDRSKCRIAVAEAAAGGGAEGSQRLAGEIVALDKRTHNTRRFSPPVWLFRIPITISALFLFILSCTVV